MRHIIALLKKLIALYDIRILILLVCRACAIVIEDFNDIGYLVSVMCLIRSEMSLERSSLKVLTTDTRGGVGASAVFLSMYEMMQEVLSNA